MANTRGKTSERMKALGWTVETGGAAKREYRLAIEKPVREAVSRCLSLRKRKTARPPMRLYKAAYGDRDPLLQAKAYIEDLCFVRDNVPTGELWVYDGAVHEVVDQLAEFALDARKASEERRATKAQPTNKPGA